MDEDAGSKPARGAVRWILLLCFLTGVRSSQLNVGSSEYEATEPPENDSEEDLQVSIAGPAFITVGVPCSFECTANCQSFVCNYSMAVDKMASPGQGNVLAFTLRQWEESLMLTCTVTNGHTGESDTVTKKLQVLAGPANVSISGPDLMSPMATHSYSCHAYCRPACNYTWMIDDGPWVGGPGNVIGIVPQELDTAKNLICKATNIVSGLFASKVLNIAVTYGPAEVRISGPDTIAVNTPTKFVCLADCMPACRYTWTVGGHTLRRNAIEITVVHPRKPVTVECQAQNTASRKSAKLSKTIWFGDHSLATRAEERSTLILCGICVWTVLLL